MDRPAQGGPLGSELAASIESSLAEQARRNEAAIARVRVAALAAVAVLDLLLWLRPPGFALPYAFSPLNALLAAIWFTVALALSWLLRSRSVARWLRWLLPVLDGVILLTLFACVIITALVPESVAPAVVNIAIACALLAVSGALRLRKRAVWVTSATAVIVFATVATLAGHPGPETVFGCALLVGVGMLGGWMNEVTRRSVRSEVGRLVLGRFLPREVLEGAHDSPLALVTAPRRFEASVLVTDLRGFTAITEHLPPEQVLSLLNRVQGLIAETVQAHGGHVDKFMGDGMLAVFGMGDNAAAHARQAIAAAAAIRSAFAGMGEAGGESVSLQVGIGVHSGPLVAGCLGSGMRMEFTVLGDTVNTASRLQEMTKQLGVDVLVSQAAWRLAGEDTPRMRQLGPQPIRGRRGEIEVSTFA